VPPATQCLDSAPTMNDPATMNATQTIEKLDLIAQASRRAAALECQRERRWREASARRQVVEVARELQERGRPNARVAQQLGLAPRTLSDWRRRHQKLLSPAWRGRPIKESSWSKRHAVLDLLEEVGPGVGLPTLQALFPDLPRCELIELQAAYRRHYRDTHRMSQEQLKWFRPGRVWAIDHSQPPRPIDGLYPAILAVRDLASGCQLAWLPVPDMEAASTTLVLETLFAEHGPPLVLKSDNGSAFRSELAQNLLATHCVVWLPSPVRTPQYNGSCEAGIGHMKVRTLFLAEREPRVGTWSCDDLEAARRQANSLLRPKGPSGPTPDDLWSRRAPISEGERTQFRTTVLDHSVRIERQHASAESPTDAPMNHSILRQAIRRALVELGLLSITRRSITLPLRFLKMAKIR
jgi:transposase InsO family protein